MKPHVPKEISNCKYCKIRKSTHIFLALCMCPVEGDMAISRIIFLNGHSQSRKSATLIANGPAGRYKLSWMI